ncbi:hypothetical protein [Clostridium taeniosporum]|uniref:Uncharacterized protein n=1 Tax=Clostridium taeniosporum TaxID=394958 RepID=A0A1D7XGR9_9CLOT|nr:hypothetical protein [Clostridium taeniosporum]AOR22249.1 hypothetical protein BGI42_00195 [Clostridium taeniosporum]
MKEFTYDKKKFELENILYDYTAMFNSKEFLPLAYADLKKINSSFPDIEDKNFYDKLNNVFLENYNMNLNQLEEYLTKSSEEADVYRRIRIFEFIRQKNI